MGYRDADWYIKDTWIGFSGKNIAKQDVAHHTFVTSRVLCCLKWQNYYLKLMSGSENETFERSQSWPVMH